MVGLFSSSSFLPSFWLGSTLYLALMPAAPASCYGSWVDPIGVLAGQPCDSPGSSSRGHVASSLVLLSSQHCKVSLKDNREFLGCHSLLMLSCVLAGQLTNPHSYSPVAGKGRPQIKATVRDDRSPGLTQWGGGLWAVSGMCKLQT